MRSILITGASGFIGTHLLAAIPPEYAGSVFCLTRRPETLASRVAGRPGWHVVSGSLGSPEGYRHALTQVDAVLHLASTTGKAAPRDYHDTIVAGTRNLVAECERHGITRFGFVSSIAVKFRDQRYYPYAQAKRQAEEMVRSSHLAHVVFRPTMVFGTDSPVLAGLRTLACAPVMVVIGDGRREVQPVDVSDVAACLWGVMSEEDLKGQTLEVGGGQVLTLEDLLRGIRMAVRGTTGPVVHVPLAPLRYLLASLEPFARSMLPLTAGQLASFANDGTADPNPVVRRHLPRPRSVAEMLTKLSDHG